jgi:hypothetical protein
MIAGTYAPPRELLELNRSALLLLRDATAPLRDLVERDATDPATQ